MLHAPEIAISLSGLTPGAERPWRSSTAEGCAWVRDRRVRGVALDAGRPDLRARDLGRSARRDIGAMLRRTELELTGIDLWIPPEHFVEPEKSQRAMETLFQTLGLAMELARLAGGRSRPLVSVNLPRSLPESQRVAIAAHADKHGSIVADHTPDEENEPSGRLVVGVDPASCLIAGVKPDGRVHGAGALRLTDANSMGRCPVGGEGSRLDLAAYAGACIVSGQRWIIADARGVPDGARAVSAAIAAWGGATGLSG